MCDGRDDQASLLEERVTDRRLAQHLGLASLQTGKVSWIEVLMEGENGGLARWRPRQLRTNWPRRISRSQPEASGKHLSSPVNEA